VIGQSETHDIIGWSFVVTIRCVITQTVILI